MKKIYIALFGSLALFLSPLSISSSIAEDDPTAVGGDNSGDPSANMGKKAAKKKAEKPSDDDGAEDAEEYSGYGKTEGIFGPVTIGPTLSLGIPRVFNGGIEGKFKDIFGFGAMYGIFPTIKVKDVRIKLTGWDVKARIFPFKSSFFLGVAYGRQVLTANAKATILGIDLNIKGETKTNYLTPHIGWHWLRKSGFFMGFDVGVQFALNANTTIDVKDTSGNELPAAVTATNDYKTKYQDVVDKGNDIGDTTLPYLTLFQVGFLF